MGMRRHGWFGAGRYGAFTGAGDGREAALTAASGVEGVTGGALSSRVSGGAAAGRGVAASADNCFVRHS